MNRFVNSGYPKPRVFATVEDAMRASYLDPGSKRSRKRFASLLESDDVQTPQELRGDAVSLNGQCEWDKKKAFINFYKHGVSFEEASLIFAENPPSGCGVIYDDPDDNGDGSESFWGIDIRDKVLGRLPGGACYIVKVDREHVHSGRVRLISVIRVSEKDVLEALRKHEINSSVSVMLRVEAATVGRYLGVSGHPDVLAEVERRIQAYENVRYLSSI